MWWSTTTVANRSFKPAALFLLVCLASVCLGQGVELRPPSAVTAGQPTTISTSGSGDGTFYLLGPGHTLKQKVRLGQEITVGADQLNAAGRYLAILCSTACQSAAFYISPASPASLSFLVHPSRVPVKQPDAISGVAIPYDKFHNLVTAPLMIDFQLKSSSGEATSRPVPTRYGVAWFRASSGLRAGSAQLAASIGQLSVRRIVQQVAGDPCNLRITGQRNPKGILVQTQPVRDCSGNPVPDGTIVTFTENGPGGKSSVDTPVKQGIAQTQLLATGPVVISVASGVVMGNQLRVEAK
jgi:hypothetical protein